MDRVRTRERERIDKVERRELERQHTAGVELLEAVKAHRSTLDSLPTHPESLTDDQLANHVRRYLDAEARVGRARQAIAGLL